MTGDSPTPERRRFQRFLFDAPSTLQTDQGEYSTRLQDISLKGALVERPRGWPDSEPSQVTLLIWLDRALYRIEMHALVVHQDPQVIGLRCAHIDMDSITHLRRLVELNLADPAVLEREFEALGNAPP